MIVYVNQGKKWTTLENDVVRNSEKSIQQIARQLGRSPQSIKHQRFRMGITVNQIWTDDELKIIYDAVMEKKHPHSVMRKLPGRSKDAIRRRMNFVRKTIDMKMEVED